MCLEIQKFVFFVKRLLNKIKMVRHDVYIINFAETKKFILTSKVYATMSVILLCVNEVNVKCTLQVLLI